MKQGKLFNNVVDFINWNFYICSSSHWHHTGVIIFKRLFKFFFKSLFHPVPCTHISKGWKGELFSGYLKFKIFFTDFHLIVSQPNPY